MTTSALSFSFWMLTGFASFLAVVAATSGMEAAMIPLTLAGGIAIFGAISLATGFVLESKSAFPRENRAICRYVFSTVVLSVIWLSFLYWWPGAALGLMFTSYFFAVTFHRYAIQTGDRYRNSYSHDDGESLSSGQIFPEIFALVSYAVIAAWGVIVGLSWELHL